MMKWIAAAVAAQLAVAAGNKADEQARFMADGEEKMLVARRCANCHAAGNFTKFRKDADAWGEVMADMLNRGAEIPDDDYDKIVAYLARSYGPGVKLSVNRAPFEEIGKLLEVSKDEAKAVVAYREARGPFKEFADLLKVPGLDSKKLESKRDLIAF